MSRKGLFTQPTREATSAQLREPCLSPTPLPVCCICRKIRDETGSSPDREHWVTQRTYRQTHGVRLANFLLTHTYCPPCFTKFMDTLRQYRREMRTSP